jgi:transcriptional regulator with AAA-type ATPase domain/polyferredoxin
VGTQRLQEAVRVFADSVEVEAGTTVVHQGDKGGALYVVESGALEVVVEAEEGVRLPVARLGPGAHFGEMSLLAGIPVSADVVASEPTVLRTVDAARFEQLVHGDPQLLEHLAGQLALRLKRTNEQLAAQQQHQAAVGRLMALQRGCPFKADLPSMARGTAVADAAQDDRPVLMTGEDGVGKRALAQHIHATSRRAHRAVLVVDCASMAADDAREQLFGDSQPSAVSRFADRLGFLQAADGGTLVLAAVDRLPLEVQADVATFLASQSPPSTSSQVSLRLIATASRPLDDLQSAGAIDPTLAEALAAGHLIAVRPLRNRRRDVVPLAEHFLAWVGRRRGDGPRRFSESARRELLGYDFPFGNAAELRQVIELAANLAEGDVITAEHLFFGPTADAEGLQLDLFRWPSVERAVRSGRILTALKVAVALAFGGIVAACLLAPHTVAGRIANMLAWGVWWPLLVVSLLLLGRAWCAVCPLSFAAEGVQRAAGRHLAPPDLLRRLGPIVSLIGFVAIVWIEETTHMLSNPLRTGMLLVSLALAAVLVAWLYQRHTWCRYLCPLGAMGAVFAVSSGLRVTARREVCAGSCTGHECFKGTDKSAGCPMFNHALYVTNGQYCKLCMRCVQDCPHQSVRLVLQPPLQDTWRSNLLSADMVPLAVVIGMLVLFLAATHTGFIESPTGSLWFALGCVAIAALGLALGGLLGSRQKEESARDVSWTARVVYAYAPAVGAILIAIRLHALTFLRDTLLSVALPRGDVLTVSTITLGEALVAVAGGAMTLWALWRVCRLRFPHSAGKAVAAWLGLASLAVACLALAMGWLV